MTFAARTLSGGVSSGGPQSANYFDSDFSTFGQAVSGVEFRSDGTVTLTSDSSNATNWYSPTISGIGNSYWILITGTGFTAGYIGTTISIGSTIFATCSTSGSAIIRTASASGNYTIYDAASGGAVVATGAITLQSEYDGT